MVVFANQTTDADTPNFTALDPTWNRETRSLRYGYSAKNVDDLTGWEAEVGLYYEGTEFLFTERLGKIPIPDSLSPQVRGNSVFFDLPIRDLPTRLSDEDLKADRIVAVVDPDNRVSETNEDADDNEQGINPFFERKIPQIMDNLGWDKAANFLERWLNGKARVLTGNLDDDFDIIDNRPQMVNINWILRDDVDTDNRAQKAFDKLKDPDYFLSQAAREVLKEDLKDEFSKSGDNKINFGDFRVKGKALHQQHIQRSEVDANFSDTPFDPLTGAMGRFSFYGIPAGVATRDGNDRVEVKVNVVGIYAVDSFDFNGFQLLGEWTPPSRVDKLPAPGDTGFGNTASYSASNASFRKYRDATGLGADFLTMSTVDFVTLDPSVTFSFDL